MKHKIFENPSSGSRVVPRGRTDGQTDTTKLTVAVRNFANAHKNGPQICLPFILWYRIATICDYTCRPFLSSRATL